MVVLSSRGATWFRGVEGDLHRRRHELHGNRKVAAGRVIIHRERRDEMPPALRNVQHVALAHRGPMQQRLGGPWVLVQIDTLDVDGRLTWWCTWGWKGTPRRWVH